jgi:SAM-dependent methyltransferase
MNPSGVVISHRILAGRLLLASFLSLFVELLLIRWIPSTLHFVAFFSNLVLIGCFLGLGIGMARSSDPAAAVWRAFFRLGVTVAVLVVLLAVNTAVILPEKGDYGVNEFVESAPGIQVPMLALLLGVFVAVVWTTIPFGQLVGACFDGLGRITAYSVNVAGSLLGVLVFTAAAWLGLSPLVWFSAALVLLFLLDRRARHLAPALIVLVALTAQHLFLVRGAHTQVLWSPYYKVVVHPVVTDRLEDGFITRVNDQFLLTGLDLSGTKKLPDDIKPEVAERIRREIVYHDFPFQLHKARRVLVLGAGVGNDTAAALHHGAEHVTAVEIDPVVIRLGDHHPQRPYADPRVRVVYDDARAYLNRTNETFDLILFATLDAHGLLSSVGNVRLDSFVYTRESLEAARRHLTDDGLLMLSFGPFREETQYRQYSTLRSVFDQEPLYFHFPEIGNRTLVAGALDRVRLGDLPEDCRRIPLEEISAKLVEYPWSALPATDDWPHLYIREPKVPREYLGVLAGILIVSLVAVLVNFRRTATGGARLDGHMFFMGAGFLLLETRSITELSLLLGSTWQVNAVVFVTILVLILAANLLVLRWGRAAWVGWCFVLLGASLTTQYLFPQGSWAPSLGRYGALAATLYLGTPLFLAALIFASTFRQTSSGSVALASNLLGAVLGGVTEYLSLAYGIRALSLLALAMYGGACLFWILQSRRARVQAVTGDGMKVEPAGELVAG